MSICFVRSLEKGEGERGTFALSRPVVGEAGYIPENTTNRKEELGEKAKFTTNGRTGEKVDYVQQQQRPL